MSKKNPSRADRLADVLGKIDCQTIEDAKTEIETLKDELQNWLDNMPDNLQGGSKADELQTAIDDLENIYDELQTATDSIDEQVNATVSFPSMF